MFYKIFIKSVHLNAFFARGRKPDAKTIQKCHPKRQKQTQTLIIEFGHKLVSHDSTQQMESLCD